MIRRFAQRPSFACTVFKNLSLYRCDASAAQTPLDALEAALDRARFQPCAPTQEKSVGWVEPRGLDHAALVEAVNGQRLLRLRVETRAVPSDVLRRAVQERAAQIEHSTGRKPGRKEMRDLRDDLRLELLPQAFTKQASVWVWIDPEAGLLAIDSTSAPRLDDVLTALSHALPALAPRLLQTSLSPQAGMTQWLAAASPDEWPGALAVERECELRSGDEHKSVVKLVRLDLLNDEVRQHLARGLRPTRLALSWDGRVAFMLTESLQLRRVQFLEGVFDAAGDVDPSERFDTDATLCTAELQRAIAGLVEALGGETESAGGTAAAAPNADASAPAPQAPAAAEDPPF